MGMFLKLVYGTENFSDIKQFRKSNLWIEWITNQNQEHFLKFIKTQWKKITSTCPFLFLKKAISFFQHKNEHFRFLIQKY